MKVGIGYVNEQNTLEAYTTPGEAVVNWCSYGGDPYEPFQEEHYGNRLITGILPIWVTFTFL